MASSSETPSVASQIRALTTIRGEGFLKSSDPVLPVSLQNMRFWLACVAGIVAGFAPIVGWYGFGIAAMIVVFLPFWHCMLVLRIPMEGDGEYKTSELLSEGTMPAIQTFLLAWVVAYSAFQVPDWEATALVPGASLKTILASLGA